MRKGEKHKCIKTVVMTDNDRIVYIEGKTYRCEHDGCLTDESGDAWHDWGVSYANEFFEKISDVSAIDLVAYTRDRAKSFAAMDYMHSDLFRDEIDGIIYILEEKIKKAYISGYDAGYNSAKRDGVV